MGYTREVRYSKQIGPRAYEPHSYSRRDMEKEMAFRAEHLGIVEAWCSECRAVVDLEPELNAAGIDHVCPWCGTRLC